MKKKKSTIQLQCVDKFQRPNGRLVNVQVYIIVDMLYKWSGLGGCKFRIILGVR